jgi:energy-coupling factor transport system ATP-binding protein
LHHLRHEKDLTVLIIEHKLDQLLDLKPEIYVLDGGKLSSTDTIAEYHASLETHFFDFPDLLKNEPSNRISAVEINGINININHKPILRDIDLQYSAGEFVALMGPNGSGKSTLLQTLMGFQKPTSGHIKVFEFDIAKTKTSTLVREIGFIFQNPDHQLFTQSVWDEVTLAVKNLGLLSEEIKVRAIDLLERIGLQNRAQDHPQSLSYGEKRRLNLLSIILHRPKMLLVDEFLIGQDMAHANAWMSFFRAYTHQGNIVLLVNHHASLTQKYCDRIIFLDQGQVLIDESVKKAFTQLKSYGFDAFAPRPIGKLSYA